MTTLEVVTRQETERRPVGHLPEISEEGQWIPRSDKGLSDAQVYLRKRNPYFGRFPSRAVTRFLPLLILDVRRAIGVFVVSVDNPQMSQNLSTSSSSRPQASQ